MVSFDKSCIQPPPTLLMDGLSMDQSSGLTCFHFYCSREFGFLCTWNATMHPRELSACTFVQIKFVLIFYSPWYICHTWLDVKTAFIYLFFYRIKAQLKQWYSLLATHLHECWEAEERGREKEKEEEKGRWRAEPCWLSSLKRNSKYITCWMRAISLWMFS